MKFSMVSFLVAVGMSVTPCSVHAEKWLEFHTEVWSHSSQKLKKNLHFSTASYYDADRIKRTANGDVTVWIRDISQNDKFYVGKGVPEKEVVYKQIRLRCNTRKYEVILEEDNAVELQETANEEIRSGSVYEKLFTILCPVAR